SQRFGLSDDLERGRGHSKALVPRVLLRDGRALPYVPQGPVRSEALRRAQRSNPRARNHQHLACMPVLDQAPAAGEIRHALEHRDALSAWVSQTERARGRLSIQSKKLRL